MSKIVEKYDNMPEQLELFTEYVKSIFGNLIPSGEQLLTSGQVANILGVTINTVYNWNYLGKLKPIIFSKRMIRYKSSDIKKLIETRETTQKKEVIS